MELLAGADLAELSPLPWPEACKYVSQAASALGMLHLRRLIHRDVSPRNVRRMPDGSVKLLDFGALTAFGSPGDVVGTAPFVAPEVLAKQSMDQRSDLYGLGALLYVLVTGVHAYPARSLRALRELWQRPWVSPSQRAALDRVDLPELPPELDAVIEALLSQDICARPFSTADLIDRLDAIAGAPRESERLEVAAAMLPRAPFTGRTRELRGFRRLLGQARSGRGGALLVESKAGGGRSRLLEEFALDARIAGTTVVTEPARISVGFRGMLQEIFLQLLDAQPELARAAAQPHASVLSGLSPEVAQRLGAMRASEASALPGEERSLLQEALCGWLFSVAKQLPVVLVLDGLEGADETFLGMGRQRGRRRPGSFAAAGGFPKIRYQAGGSISRTNAIAPCDHCLHNRSSAKPGLRREAGPKRRLDGDHMQVSRFVRTGTRAHVRHAARLAQRGADARPKARVFASEARVSRDRSHRSVVACLSSSRRPQRAGARSGHAASAVKSVQAPSYDAGAAAST